MTRQDGSRSIPARQATASKRTPKLKGKTVDEYIAGLKGWQAGVVAQIRKIVKEAAPAASESIKWGQPVYEENGPFCWVKAFRNHVSVGFWRAADLPDPAGLLEGSGAKMRHMKVTGPDGLANKALQDFVRAAVKLNRAEGNPTRSS